jgi:glycosyltransferase involved in cell wall biosynthesis
MAFGQFDTIYTPLSRLRYRFDLATQREFWLRTSKQDVTILSDLIRQQSIGVISPVGAHHFQGALAGAKTHTPIAWQIHSALLPAFGRFVFSRVISRHATVVLFNGRTNQQRFSIHGKVPKYFFFPPVDEHTFRYSESARNALRNELLIPKDAPVIGTVGNLGRQKRHDVLIKTLLAVRNRMYPSPVHAIIVGRKLAAQETWYRRNVLREIAKHRLEGIIHFISGDERDVCNALSAMDVFVLTSQSEGMPLAIAEAAMTGLPVISSDVGAVRDFKSIIPDVKLFPFGRVDAMADAIVKALGKQFSRASLSITEFSSHSVARCFADALKKAVEIGPKHTSK